jgi:lipopolysaccharide export LptBFGC system permease protein LptF
MAPTGTTSQVLRDPQRRRITGKLVFLLAGTVSFLLSVGLWFLGDDRETALFVGLWVPSLFSLGALVASPERHP